MDKNQIIKIILVILIIIVGIIYNFFVKEQDSEKIYYSDYVINNSNGINNENIVEEKNKIKVYVIGEVRNPGVIELEEGARIEEAIILAGGTTDKSDLSKMNLAYYLEDGQKIVVPSIYDDLEEKEEPLIEYEIEENTESKKININTANSEELQELSGIGEALAERIISYREENGKFKNIEDLKNVSGIGEKKFDSLKEFIKVK